MKRFLKRIITTILASLLLFSNVLTVAASEVMVNTNEKMKSALSSQQFFVYQLNNIILDNQYSLHQTIVNDSYFDEKTRVGLKSIFSFNNIGKAFWGTMDVDYYRKAMAECITLGEYADTSDAAWEVTKLFSDTAIEKLKELNGGEEYLTVAQKEAMGVYDVFSNGLDYVTISSEAGELLNKISYYSGSLLNALELVGKHAEINSDIKKAATYVSYASRSTDMSNKFIAWAEQFLLDVQGSAIEILCSVVSASITDWSSIGHEVLAGDAYDKEMKELYYLNLQNEIAATFYAITDKYPSVLDAKYSNEDIKNLWDLTLLYLKCGKLGFEYKYPDNENACITAYQEVQLWNLPWNIPAENAKAIFTLYDYNVPENLSKGDTYVVYGLISSTDTLKNVSVEIKGSNGYLKETAGDIYSHQFDVHQLDHRIALNHLNAGDYEYILHAESINGHTQEILRVPFTISHEDGNMIITNYRLPHPMSKGEVFRVCGTISSKETINEVKVEIIDTNGNYVTGDSEQGDFKTYDLNRLDAETRFDILNTGTYHYVIKARNLTGEEILVNQKFLVK